MGIAGQTDSLSRWLDWVRGPDMEADEAEEFAAYTRELTSTLWPLLGVLLSLCAFLWWPLDLVVFADEPNAIAAFHAFRSRLIPLDLTLAFVLPSLRPLRRYVHHLAFLAASANLALAGWYLAEAGEPHWLHFGFVTPVFSVLLPVPLIPRIAATAAFGVTLCTTWLIHSHADLGTPGVLAGFSFMTFLVGLDVVIGHLLFVQVQRSYHLSRRLEAQRKDLQVLADHLEDRVERQTSEIRSLSERARQARAEQRREIARDLHDGIGQELTSLRLLIGLRARLQPNASGALSDVDAQITSLQGSLRRILESLQPEPLADGSLLDALENLCGEMERRSGLPCTFTTARAAVSLPARVSIDLFRIAQEGLTNAVRHARASRLQVHLEGAGGRLILSVTDDGVGFDPATCKQGHGTRNIRERAQGLGGTATWSHDGGTRLVASVPLENSP